MNPTKYIKKYSLPEEKILLKKYNFGLIKAISKV